MRDISVRIDHLLLEGVSNNIESGERLGRMTEAALQRLLEHQGAEAGIYAGDRAEVEAPNITLPPGASDEQIAQAVALAVVQALGERR